MTTRTKNSLTREIKDLKAQIGLSPRDLDYFVWAVYRKGGHVTI